MNRDEFRSFVRNIILEVKEEKKEESPYMKRKDRPNSYLNGEKSKYKKNVDNKPSQTVHALLNRIVNVVKGIDKNIEAILDDHNDISVRLPGVFRIRVRPNWSDNYTVEAFRNMSDRVYAVGLNGKQVMDFIRVNFVANKKGYVQSAYDKSMDNMKDKTDKKAEELPKSEKIPEKEVPDKEKEDSVTDKKDEPDAPMSVAEEPKKQEDYGVEKNKQMPKIQKMIKKTSDGQ